MVCANEYECPVKQNSIMVKLTTKMLHEEDALLLEEGRGKKRKSGYGVGSMNIYVKLLLH